MQLMGCINHTNTDTYVNIMMNRKEKPDGAKGCTGFVLAGAGAANKRFKATGY